VDVGDAFVSICEICEIFIRVRIFSVQYSVYNDKNVHESEINIKGPPKKCKHTLTKENSTFIIDYCKSTIYFRQNNNMIYVFTSI
jgi:hypothetical protein